MPDDTTISTRVIQRALAFRERIQERIRTEYAASIGYEKVGTKATRALIRKALGGDGEAMAEVQQLHQINQYPDGRNPVENEIKLMIEEHNQNIWANIGASATNGTKPAATVDPFSELLGG